MSCLNHADQLGKSMRTRIPSYLALYFEGLAQCPVRHSKHYYFLNKCSNLVWKKQSVAEPWSASLLTLSYTEGVSEEFQDG